jgi:hypothetical protein
LKQALRFFFDPATFVNQLQWSKNHSWILLAFLGIAVTESQVGTGRELNLQLSWLLSRWAGVGRDQALFAVMAARVAVLFFGALSLAETIWWVADWFGYSTSKRVLKRRLVVVLTVLLSSYSLFSSTDPTIQNVALGLLAWALLLNIFTLREQFRIGTLQAALLGLLASGFILASWKVSDQILHQVAGNSIQQQLAKKNGPRHHAKSPHQRRRTHRH